MTEDQRRQEAEATHFATCLLMPRDLVLQELARAQEEMGHTHWEDVIQRLAKLFGVTAERMALRVGELVATTLHLVK